MKRTKMMLALACCASVLAGCNTTTAKEDTTTKQVITEVQNTESESTTENVAQETTALEASYPVNITIYDSTGAEYAEVFEQAPERVVTVRTSAAEILIELGLADKIVGISNPDNEVPEELQATFSGFNNLGDRKSLSKEVIVAAEPDIIIGQAGQFAEETSIDKYAELGILSYTQLAGNTAVSSGPEALLDDIRNLGEIFGVQERAEEYVSELESRLNAVKDSVAARQATEPLRSLTMVNFNDGVFGVMNDQMQDEIMAMLGCEDVADKGQSGLTYENLIQYNPDVIIYIMADRNAATDANAVETLLNEELIQSIPAIANKKIIAIPYDSFMDVGPRMIDAIEEINNFLNEY